MVCESRRLGSSRDGERFRGRRWGGLFSPPGAAIGISALLFGAMHGMREPPLRLFAVWGALQGLLLGALYVATGSLLVTMLVHGAHDMTGFTLFAWERRSGKRPGPVPGSPP